MRKVDPRVYRRRANKIRDDLKKEFRLHRCLFHHYDVIDFVVFEFGMRVTYLVSRVLSMILIPLLLASIYDQFLAYEDTATPYSGLIYMHIWLSFLLVISVLFEVGALLYAAVTLPTCDIVCQSAVPWYFQVMWFMYNAIYVNIMSCGTMYSIFQIKSKIGLQYYYFLMICAYAGIHCGSTAIPSRMGHLMHPFSLTLLHIFFTAIYQSGGGTDPTGAHYVYEKMDWNYKIESTLVAVFWCFLTLVCHIVLVFSSWTRRKMFRHLRKGKEALINYNPDDASSACSVDQDGVFHEKGESPRIWIEDIPGDPTGHKRVVVDSSPLKRSYEPKQYIYHEVYRDPSYPGEKRKRLILEQAPSPHSGRRYCFAPADPAGGPPPYYQAPDIDHHPKQEKGYICHPEVSPDGQSMVYTCRPEQPRRPECYHCAEERRWDRAEVREQVYAMNPQERPHSFVFSQRPTERRDTPQTFTLCQGFQEPEPIFTQRGGYDGVRLNSVDTQTSMPYSKQPDSGAEDDQSSCLSRKKPKAKEVRDSQTYTLSQPEAQGTLIW
ncbi:uncharacterized protein LOC106078926 [Biomphalaria glabrata]|uniref:Uncharacterized protein LOC106078926 n=1 Tax=Biomphalaria glabrata TaxID=6526 RepID=A0A9U8ENJ6_BIOGL|nr:uncharacterized protein LOC106078926 [Biomphalaria glabrata]XP_013095472.2 uncharacterized protein LOC106078926 [Biomphalaria glabrata]XP_013095473.2 uncharacterized protein LOC106078926 [Biomphalaria glabrata]